jgi:hypothetical protein
MNSLKSSGLLDSSYAKAGLILTENEGEDCYASSENDPRGQAPNSL